MKIFDLQAELSMKSIEFEKALNQGLSRNELIRIYRELKELQYQLAMTKAEGGRPSYDELIE